jgi:hypothetical protein
MSSSRFRMIWLLILIQIVACGQLSPIYAQFRHKSSFTEIKWQDYTFKFLPGNRMAQVIDSNNHVIGTIIDQGGDLQLLPTVTGDEADKLQKSFQAWKDSGGEAAVGYKATKPSTPAASASAVSPSAAGATAKPGLTVDGVISMLQAGISDDVIIEKVHKSWQTFDLSADDMVRLKNAKASDALMKAMIESGPPPATAAAQGATTAPPSQTAATSSPTASAATQSATSNAATSKTASNNTTQYQGHGNGMGSVFDAFKGKSVIDHIGLRNALPQWDPGKPLSEQFPHIAITVDYAPSGWMDSYLTDASAQGRSVLSHCYKLEATVWSDAKTSKKIPFEWCSNKDEFLDRLGPDYLTSLYPRHIDRDYNTGIQRTDGPEPPSTLLPNDRKTLDMEAKTNPHGMSPDLNRDITTQFALMFANIRKDLGQTLTSDGDPRVWIVSIKKASGPSIF